MKRWSSPLIALLALLGLLTAACGDDSDNSDAAATTAAAAETTVAASTTAEAPTVEGEITVFAAASLTESFTEVGDAFTEANPDSKATFSFDASSALATQIIEGAPADVFASADVANMTKVTDESLNGTEPVIFATNPLTIVVAPGNPAGITGVADLANPDLKVVLCAAEVPCGRYAAQVLETAAVTVTPVSLEQNVRGVLTKVTAGEADAGIVYVTDVTAAGADGEAVEIPADINVVAEYPIATVAASGRQEVGEAFVDFLLGPEGQAIMASHGFGAP